MSLFEKGKHCTLYFLGYHVLCIFLGYQIGFKFAFFEVKDSAKLLDACPPPPNHIFLGVPLLGSAQTMFGLRGTF